MNTHNKPPVLVIRNLSKEYNNGFMALKNINLTVPQGNFFALLGPNGAGKSTMIGIISSLLRPTTGSVQIMGVDLLKNPSEAKQLLGVVPQEFNFNQFEKVLDVLIIQAGYFGISANIARTRAENLLKKLGLWDKKHSKARELSGGMKRRLMIARALIHRPKLLILDEPTAGVDIELRRSMWDFIQEINKQEDTTIILTTHYLEEAEQLCKDIAILQHGEILINTNMKDLISTLDIETFVFELASACNTPKNTHLNNVVKSVFTDEFTLEVTVKSDVTLNHIFEQLNQQGIVVKSMRNKSNRLEELFMQVVQRSS